MGNYQSKCPCGALHLKVTGEPVHNHACSCLRCQRSSGSVLGQNAWFLESDVQIISGKYSVWYPEGKTNPDVMKAFCQVCGGGGFSKSGSYLPGTVVIAVGTFADTSFPIPDHVHWWGSKPHWIEVAEEIERLPGN